MTNHVHLLATLALDDSIGRVFQSVGRRYVRYFNVSYGRSGTRWEGRYRGTVVDSEQRSKKASDTVRHDILQGSLALGREGHFDAEAVPAYVEREFCRYLDNARRMVETAAHLADHVMARLPVRQ